jgi:DNA replication protein DnaC
MSSPDLIPTTLSEHLRQLGLVHTASDLNDFVARATQKRWSPVVQLERLVQAELEARLRQRVERRLKDARLGRFKPMVDWEWEWPKAIQRPTVERVLTLDFLAQRENVIVVAPHGLGKTMLAKNLVYQAILAGHSARFLTAADLILDLTRQETARALQRRLRSYLRPTLLAIDEVGYLAYDPHAADLLFQVVSRRYEQKSIVITTNLPFKHWDTVFPNAACAVALIDRLTHHAEIISIDGESYRKREAEQSQKRKQEQKSKR